MSGYLRFGWPIGDEERPFYPGPVEEERASVRQRRGNRGNRLSVYENYQFVDSFINQQVKENRIAGPFSPQHSPFPDTYPHLVSLKTSESAGKRRLILQPFALNAATPSFLYLDGAPPFPRPDIYQFARRLGQLGPGAWMWRRDLRSYYLQLPLDPRDYPKLR